MNAAVARKARKTKTLIAWAQKETNVSCCKEVARQRPRCPQPGYFRPRSRMDGKRGPNRIKNRRFTPPLGECVPMLIIKKPGAASLCKAGLPACRPLFPSSRGVPSDARPRLLRPGNAVDVRPTAAGPLSLGTRFPIKPRRALCIGGILAMNEWTVNARGRSGSREFHRNTIVMC